jgi:hypothetical protein
MHGLTIKNEGCSTPWNVLKHEFNEFIFTTDATTFRKMTDGRHKRKRLCTAKLDLGLLKYFLSPERRTRELTKTTIDCHSLNRLAEASADQCCPFSAILRDSGNPTSLFQKPSLSSISLSVARTKRFTKEVDGLREK